MTHTFFLQVIQRGRFEDFEVTQNETELKTPPPRTSWQRYKLIIEEDRLVFLEKTQYLVPKPETFTLEKNKGQAVPLHSCSPLMGCEWRTGIKSSSKPVEALIELIEKTLATPVKG